MVWLHGAPSGGDRALLAGQRALVLGLGVHGGGVGVARYLAQSGAAVRVTDLQPADRLASSISALDAHDITFTLGRRSPRRRRWFWNSLVFS